MALLRSRSLPATPLGYPGPAVNRASQALADAEAAAYAAGEAAAAAAAAARIKKLEKELREQAAAGTRALTDAEAAWNRQWQDCLLAMQAATAQLQAMQAQAIAEAEQDSVHLAVALASRVLHHQVEVDPHWLDSSLKEVLQKVPGRRAVTIRLAPSDCERLGSRVEELLPEGMPLPELQAVASLPPGSCEVVSGGTRFDAGVISSWQRLAAVLATATPVPEAASAAPAETDPADGEVSP